MFKVTALLLLLSLGTLHTGAAQAAAWHPLSPPVSSKNNDAWDRSLALSTIDGLQFQCSKEQIQKIKPHVYSYLKKLGVAQFLLQQDHVDIQQNLFVWSLRLSPEYVYGTTLTFFTNPVFAIKKQKIPLIDEHHKTHYIDGISEKEIALSLFANGRISVFKSQNSAWQRAGEPNVVGGCEPTTLQEHIGLRQMVSAWSQKLQWVWPDGGSAKWNTTYWHKGTPIFPKNIPINARLVQAVRNMFTQQHKYSIGCYTAAKMVYVQAYLDYYARVNPNAQKLQLVVDRLLTPDSEPLVDIEPQKMWYFEDDYTPTPHLPETAGKLLVLQDPVDSSNFIPGDWTYIRNTDPATKDKTGYEGSNAIYLGFNLFDDFYNDHQHGYPFERKLDEVYQWRYGVFSRSNHAPNIHVLNAQQKDSLKYTPAQGGLLESYRAVPFVPSYFSKSDRTQ